MAGRNSFAGFELLLNADGSEVSKTLKDLQKELKDFQKQLADTKDVNVIGQLNKKLEDTKVAMSGIRKVGLGDEFNKIKPSANSAAQAMTNLSRVAQDAPYGFIGIANNLDPLLESFQRLRVETGSSKEAFKSLLSSLTGAGGLAIGLAVVSSLVVTAQREYGSLGTALDVVFGSISNITRANIQLNKTLSESAAGTAGELARLQALVNIAQDEARSKNSRVQAIRALNKEYDNYLPNLDLENIKSQEVTKAIDKLSASLVRQAKIKGVQDLISKETGKQAELLSKGLSENAAWYDEILISLKNFGNIGGAAYDRTIAGAKRLGRELTDSEKRILQFNKALQTLIGTEADAGTLIVDPIKIPKDAKGKASKSMQELFFNINEEAGTQWQKLIDFSEKESERFYNEWARQISAADKKQQIIDTFNRTNDAINKGIVGFSAGGSIDPFGGLALKAQESRQQIEAALATMGQTPRNTEWLTDEGARLQLITEQWKQYSAQVAQTGAFVNQFLAPAFGQFFDSLMSGTQTAGQALRAFFSGLIKQIISTVAQAAALAAVMSAITGGGFGGLFKGFLGGGIPTGGGGAATNGIGFNPAQWTFKIHGNDLLASVNRSANANMRIGGGGLGG